MTTQGDQADVVSTTAAVRRTARLADVCGIWVGLQSRGAGRPQRTCISMAGLAEVNARWLAQTWGGTATAQDGGTWQWECRKGALRIARKLMGRDGLQTAATRRRVQAGMDAITAARMGDTDD